jgi:DNA-binding CsgD family transcriptional regulator
MLGTFCAARGATTKGRYAWPVTVRVISTPVFRTILIYGVLLAAGAFGLQWLEFQFVVRTHATETYVVLVALAFMGLGVWVGARLIRRPPATPFEPNLKARETLGVSDRELQVLELLAAGRSNKEIAQQLEVSPNTVKTHVAKLFEKLAAKRRTEAISRARELGMIR